MHVFYEEDGSFKVATVKESQPASLMVEDVRGKRSKVKAGNVLLNFERPDPATLWSEAEAFAADIDVDFLWEVCEQVEFAFDKLAADYFGEKPTAPQQAAVLFAITHNPMYFYRKGKGHYKPAPEDNLKAAKAGLERKQREAEQVASWQAELVAGKLPEALKPQLKNLLHRPDKNRIEWKALAQAADAAHTSPLRLLERVGAIEDVEQYLLDGFLFEYFPKGREFEANQTVCAPTDLPLADIAAFSIDDATTTEIDDAFSLKKLSNGNTQVGIHIAAPALGITPDSELDKHLLERLSTVYFPGDKITMLPDSAVRVFTLEAGCDRPALSMYLEIGPGFDILSHRSVIERVPVAANLRHGDVEQHFNEDTAGRDGGDYPWKEELTFLWHLAGALEARRGRGDDPNAPVRIDYSFYVDKRDDGSKQVRIVPRKRGAPMDKLVAELMIHVNSQWGKDLKAAEMAAIYRTQSQGRVRMTTQAGPHVGLGVDCYAWSSSPLRRAVDFINQQQLLAMVRGEKPRYAKNDAALFAVIGAFDTAYAAYAEFQDKMERYWCLRFLEQENIKEMSGIVLKENLVRIDGMPLLLRVAGLPELPAGSAVILQRMTIDYLDLDVQCRLATI